jgi:uncharacterized repeat protein (TIGR04076 family)
MTKVKISVLKCFTNEEIFDGDVPEAVSKYGSKCHKHHPGQIFIMDSLDCPEGFCTWAYSDIYRDLVQIAWDGSYPWIKVPGVTFSSCTDGQKPVIFKIERV